MTKEKGYYNMNSGEFLGVPQISGPGQAELIFSIRTTHGVCFGEFDSETGGFVPETNPFIRDFNKTLEIEEDIDSFAKGVKQLRVLGGGNIDSGAELQKKKVYIGQTWDIADPLPGVTIKDNSGGEINKSLVFKPTKKLVSDTIKPIKNISEIQPIQITRPVGKASNIDFEDL